jgi:HAMP domain-containing protein
MKLLLKFNLVFLLVFVIGLAVSGLVARTLLQRDAEAEVLDRARLLMEKALVVSAYTANQVAPLLQTQMKYTFLPQSIPAYSSTEIINALQKTYPDYSYKPAMLNPTNPRDRAVAWEEDVINAFKKSAELKEFIGQRDTPTGPALYIARPIRISNPNCLQCHSTPEAAPQPMVDKYGPGNGFGWTLNETLGAQVVSVPMTLPLARADRAFTVVLAMLAGVFLLIGGALNLMLWKLVIQPVSRLSALSDRVSMGELDAPEFLSKSKDEIGVLADSFGRMRKSLVHAMKMLET